ncbi:hypothetical protein QBC32DRAFT_356744 [Pseudoneurospora amorphoporcata]|uniref:Uncharacterized protein n=1 Tax=Pseudoneurospora amorphoporcata TaxID=241081 RepID=A0AAN6SA67_9PEZI|nr:hypothetical protein QBC32DRAFT_356744 [Pseudoneurospora amorphoporcata]
MLVLLTTTRITIVMTDLTNTLPMVWIIVLLTTTRMTTVMTDLTNTLLIVWIIVLYIHLLRIIIKRIFINTIGGGFKGICTS